MNKYLSSVFFKKMKIIFILHLILSTDPPANAEQIQLSVIPESIKYNWDVNEFTLKIKNPSGIKTRIKIIAQCIHENKIIKEVSKEYEIMLTEDTTQMSITSKKCNNINLSGTQTTFFTQEEKHIYKQFYKKK